jgi:hypothetical protein
MNSQSTTLSQFAAAAQEYSNFVSDGRPSQNATGSSASSGYTPADSLGANPGYNMNSTANMQRQGNMQRRGNGMNGSPVHAQPNMVAQNRVQGANSTPSRAGSVSTTSKQTPQMQNTPTSPAQPNGQKPNDLIFRNSTSAFPNGTPPISRAGSKSQVYTTSQGVVQTDPWATHYYPSPDEFDDADATSKDPAVLANPHSDTFPLIPDPPNLEEWRTKFFNVTDTLVLSEQEYLTYFPHVDNVYSHRSTQKYKRKAFVSHYWDCRLKGRPSGTPKSDDPNKKKRKRQARERDLCDVKIKITEYFSAEQAREMGLTQNELNESNALAGGTGALVTESDAFAGDDNAAFSVDMNAANQAPSDMNGFGDLSANADPNFGLLQLPRALPQGHPGADGKRWYTIQRVKGNPGGGAVRGTADPDDDEADQSLIDSSTRDHKHTLEDSDRIKKNSVQRWMMKEEKEKKRLSVCSPFPAPLTRHPIRI